MKLYKEIFLKQKVGVGMYAWQNLVSNNWV